MGFGLVVAHFGLLLCRGALHDATRFSGARPYEVLRFGLETACRGSLDRQFVFCAHYVRLGWRIDGQSWAHRFPHQTKVGRGLVPGTLWHSHVLSTCSLSPGAAAESCKRSLLHALPPHIHMMMIMFKNGSVRRYQPLRGSSLRPVRSSGKGA